MEQRVAIFEAVNDADETAEYFDIERDVRVWLYEMNEETCGNFEVISVSYSVWQDNRDMVHREAMIIFKE